MAKRRRPKPHVTEEATSASSASITRTRNSGNIENRGNRGNIENRGNSGNNGNPGNSGNNGNRAAGHSVDTRHERN